jgi:hypothetical protein
MLLVTKTEFARATGRDVRSLRNLPEPVHFLLSGVKHVPLYPFPDVVANAALHVHAKNHPLEKSKTVI